MLYQGERRWSAPRSLTALVDLPAGLEQELQAFIPAFVYLVDDLSAVPDESLRQRTRMTALARLAMIFLKHLRGQVDPIDLMGDWIEELRAVMRAPRGLEALESLLRYIVLVNEQVETVSLQRFVEQEIGPEAKEIVMTLGEQLIQQRLEKGIQQGLEQGRAEGERGLLLRLQRQRFGDAAIGAEAERRIQAAKIAQIETWARRVLSAATLDEVLAD